MTERTQAHTAPHKREALTSPMRLFNTLTRQVEEVVPLEQGHIRMYSCGPTVYRNVHIGNLRTFAMADWIRRTLRAQGYVVKHVKNITDVGHMRQERLDQGEDKLIAQALSEGKTPWDIARYYTDAFLRDETRLNILPAHQFPRATDHIPQMIAMTERLLEAGHAYEVEGNVFFSVKSYPGYGQLSGNLLEYLGQGQVTANEMTALKRAPEDFPLWKAAEPGRVMLWDSPWGRGFPGWHIECSAMSRAYLGEQLDLHTGGVDNIFPHHEDERAQSEAANGKPFVRLWVHAQHLLADGLKMAKSTGNAYTLSDLEARGYTPLALRYLFTTAKYRSRLNFTFRALRGAEVALTRLRARAAALAQTRDGARVDQSIAHEHRYWHAFLEVLLDDLNLPRAMSVVWRTVRDESLPAELRVALLDAFDEVLGLDLMAAGERSYEHAWSTAVGVTTSRRSGSELPEDVRGLVERRAHLRLAGDYAAADALRQRVRAAGFAVGDTAMGALVTPLADDVTLIGRSTEVTSLLAEPDAYTFSVALLARNNRDDLQRCVESVVRYAGGRSIELVLLENGSTDETLAYVRTLLRAGSVASVPVRVILADHDLGFAAARNATFRACLGRYIVQLDTSIEVTGDIWTPLEELLRDASVGVAGPFGLISRDLKEYEEHTGPDVDAIEGYLFAFRRALLAEVGPADERFRFYRMMDVDYSLEFKRAGYRAVASAVVAERVSRHPHREWYSLSTYEQATRSKRNFDLYWKRRHHAQSLLVANYPHDHGLPWSHDHDLRDPQQFDPLYEHGLSAGPIEHSHAHRHWPDHAHSHVHAHGGASKTPALAPPTD